MEMMMTKKSAEKLVRKKINAEFMRFKKYVEEIRKNWGFNPPRDWIRMRLSMDEAAAFLGEKSIYGITWRPITLQKSRFKLYKAKLKKK